MAINPNRVTQRVLERIAQSEHLLTVYYPVAKTMPVVEGPTSLPVSPLLAKPNPQARPSQDFERVKPEVSMKCLVLELSMIRQIYHEHVKARVPGWTREVSLIARVDAAEADLDGGKSTVFDGSAYVDVDGRRFTVVNVIRESSSLTYAGTYYVYLTGAAKE